MDYPPRAALFGPKIFVTLASVRGASRIPQLAVALLLSSVCAIGSPSARMQTTPEAPRRDSSAEESRFKGVLAGAYNSLGLIYFEQGNLRNPPMPSRVPPSSRRS